MDVDTKKVWVSPKSRELFHFAPDEEINYESYFRVIHPEDRERVNQEVQQRSSPERASSAITGSYSPTEPSDG